MNLWARSAFVLAVVLAPLEAHAGRSDHVYVRLDTPRGAVHTWAPAGYDPATAGVVIYVHGYHTDVDRAWQEHRLARQVARSGLNALFVACEAPSGPRDPVVWPSLTELLAAVADGLGTALPPGRVVAIGHSGAHRTLSEWLADARLDTVMLLDAMFGDKPQFRDWLAGAEGRRLVDVAARTRPWSERLHATLPDAAVFDRFPSAFARQLRNARDARVVYARSQHDHMRLVTGGVALPMILRTTRVPKLERARQRR